MIYNYKKVRHLELVKRFLNLKNQGKDIYTLYKEKPDEYIEFKKYRVALYHPLRTIISLATLKAIPADSVPRSNSVQL